jgi:hypothetical protein
VLLHLRVGDPDLADVVIAQEIVEVREVVFRHQPSHRIVARRAQLNPGDRDVVGARLEQPAEPHERARVEPDAEHVERGPVATSGVPRDRHFVVVAEHVVLPAQAQSDSGSGSATSRPGSCAPWRGSIIQLHITSRRRSRKFPRCSGRLKRGQSSRLR